jgi:hypothetical protein
VREQGIANVSAITADLERHRRGEVDAASRLFSFAEFGLWSDLATSTTLRRELAIEGRPA